MTYHGHVTVGGDAEVRELAELVITKIAVGDFENNAYVLRCRRTDEQLLIDAADDADRLLATVGDDGLATVVTTHRHHDHWQALAQSSPRPAPARSPGWTTSRGSPSRRISP